MSVYECKREFFIPNVCHRRFFDAYCRNYQDIMRRIEPDGFKHIVYLDGDGGVGTVKKIHWADGHETRTIDDICNVNFNYNYTVSESHFLTEKVERTRYQTVFIPENGGVRIKKIANYHHNEDVEIIKEHAERDIARIFDHYDCVGRYLQQNPSLYL